MTAPVIFRPSLHPSLPQELSNPVPPCLCTSMAPQPDPIVARRQLPHRPSANGLSFSSSPTYDSSPVKFYDQFHAITFSASPAFCTSAIFLQDPKTGLTLIHPASSSLGLTAVHDTSLPEPCHLCLFLHHDKRSLQLTSSASVAPSSQTPAYLFLTSPGNALFI